MTSFERIVGRLVVDVPQTMQVLQAFMIGCFGTDFAYSHHLIAIDTDWIFEAVAVPKLEQGHVKADMGRVERLVEGDLFKEAGKVLDVIHFASDLLCQFSLKKGSCMKGN